MRRSGSFLPLLDVISCALGAGVLLAVIFSIIEVPIPAPKSDDFIAIEITSSNKHEVWGLIAVLEDPPLVKRIVPSEVVLSYLNMADVPLEERGAVRFLGRHGVLTGINEDTEDEEREELSVSAFVLAEPVEGEWLLVPYLHDTSEETHTRGRVNFRWKTKRVEVEGCNCRISDQPLMPGDTCASEPTEPLDPVPYDVSDSKGAAKCKDGVGYVRVSI